MAEAWSQAENEAVVAEYFAMLEQELAGQSYVKMRAIERVQAMTGRSRTSVEYKFQNISGVLRELHAPWVQGFKPASNYQGALADVVESWANRPVVLELMRKDVERAAVPRVDFTWNVVVAPTFDAFPVGGNVVPLHTDFVRLEAANRSLGTSGELIVLERERAGLLAEGRRDLAGRVEHVSTTRGDGLGYDISSFDPDGRPRLIEVKTTRRGKDWPMFVSRNEVAVSRSEAGHYVLARVFDFARPEVGLFELPGAIEDTCVLEPESYRALPKAG